MLVKHNKTNQFITWDRYPSFPVAVTLICIVPEPFIEPPITKSSFDFWTFFDSPVTKDSSTDVSPCIPTDGVLIKGETSVDESLVTGESKKVQKSNDDLVIGGSINGSGTIQIKVLLNQPLLQNRINNQQLCQITTLLLICLVVLD